MEMKKRVAEGINTWNGVSAGTVASGGNALTLVEA